MLRQSMEACIKSARIFLPIKQLQSEAAMPLRFINWREHTAPTTDTGSGSQPSAANSRFGWGSFLSDYQPTMQKPWIKNLDIIQDLRMSFHAQFPTIMRRLNVSPGRPDNGVESFDLGIKRPGICRNNVRSGAEFRLKPAKKNSSNKTKPH